MNAKPAPRSPKKLDVKAAANKISQAKNAINAIAGLCPSAFASYF